MADVSPEAAIARLLVGSSVAMQRLRALIARIAPLDLPVLVEGPTGSGKELVATALHRSSGRSGRFVSFNVCAIPETMLEDALFGHIRGAFTGATRDAPGYLAEADHGTAFFDEIGGLPIAAQAKLLRAIELREFRPVGATRDRRSDFRLVAATNEDLDALAAAKRFRPDLIQRLRGVVIVVPALADRLDDIPELVQHFLAEGRRAGVAEHLTDQALRLLQGYEWPGNVRELRHAIARMRALASAPAITARDVAIVLEQRGHGPVEPAGEASTASSASALRRRLLVTLDETDGDTAAVARRLGVGRATVYRWLKLLGIPTPQRRHGLGERSGTATPDVVLATPAIPTHSHEVREQRE